jgi:hypothetical protein
MFIPHVLPPSPLLPPFPTLCIFCSLSSESRPLLSVCRLNRPFHASPDSRTVPKHGLLGPRHLRYRRGLGSLLSQASVGARGRRGRHARCAAALSRGVLAL